MHLSQSIHPYFAKNLGEKVILAFFVSLVSLYTLTVVKAATPISMAQQVAPAISSVSGIVSDGSNITITGSGFGVKSQAAPLRWDDFDSGTLGARLPSQANGGWTTGANQAGKEPRYSNTHVRMPGALSAYQNFTGGNYNSEISLQSLFDGNVYMSGWFYRTSSGTPSRNFKWIQLRQGDLDEASWEFRQDAYPSTNSGHMYVANSCPNGIPCSLCDDEVGIPGYTSANCNMYYGMNGDLKTGSWHRYEIWLTQGTRGQNDGHARIWLDGQPWMNMNGVFDPSGCRFHNMWLGFYFATDTGAPQPQMETWWDELYVDTTPARVEICPNATWANKGKCEVQVASTWSNGQVTVSVNQGALNNGQNAYVYLVDANNVASHPYPVTIAGTYTPPIIPLTDTQAPSAPANLSATATSTQISLSWSASTDNVGVTGYNILRSNTNGSGYTQVATTNTNSYINTGLVVGTTYYYIVRAFDAATNVSANSGQAQATTSASSGSLMIADNAKIVFLHHSTGGNVWTTGNVASWFTSHGYRYQLSNPWYPGWQTDSMGNYPYEYWNLWVNNACSNDSHSPCLGPATQVGTLTKDYDVIIFKHCYPGSDILADIGRPNVASSRQSIENYKLQYRALRALMDQYPNKLFIIWTLPPLNRAVANSNNSALANAQRATDFTTWVKTQWLTEDGQSHKNIAIFDFRDIVVGKNSSSNDYNFLRNDYANGTDSHPNSTANQVAGPLLAQFIVDSISSFNNTTTPLADTQAPSVPANLTASATNTQITLNWTVSTDNVGVSQYLIERSNNSSSGFSQIATATTNSYINTGLSANTTYYYRVRAIDLANNYSIYSNVTNATTPVEVILPPTITYSSWCSALRGIVSATITASGTNRIADLNHDGAVNASDVALMSSWHNQGNDTACQAQFINTYTSSNYLSIDWCSGVFTGLQDSLGSTQGGDKYSTTFDLNNDGWVNLTDTAMVAQYQGANNQSACFAEYSLPLAVDSVATQKITELPTISAPAVDNTLIKKVNASKTELAKLKLLRGYFVQLEDGSNVYINTTGKVINIDTDNIVQTLAKETALGINKTNLAKLSVSIAYQGVDSDGDSLADDLEAAIGTNPNVQDTDNDGYPDGVEVLNNYNPNNKSAKAKINNVLAKRLSGRILLSVSDGSLFYVNPTTLRLELLKNANLENLNTSGIIKQVKGLKIRK